MYCCEYWPKMLKRNCKTCQEYFKCLECVNKGTLCPHFRFIPEKRQLTILELKNEKEG